MGTLSVNSIVSSESFGLPTAEQYYYVASASFCPNNVRAYNCQGRGHAILPAISCLDRKFYNLDLRPISKRPKKGFYLGKYKLHPKPKKKYLFSTGFANNSLHGTPALNKINGLPEGGIFLSEDGNYYFVTEDDTPLIQEGLHIVVDGITSEATIGEFTINNATAPVPPVLLTGITSEEAFGTPILLYLKGELLLENYTGFLALEDGTPLRIEHPYTPNSIDSIEGFGRPTLALLNNVLVLDIGPGYYACEDGRPLCLEPQGIGDIESEEAFGTPTLTVAISPIFNTLDISSYVNNIGMTTDGFTFSVGGLDGDPGTDGNVGNVMSATLLGNSLTIDGVTWDFMAPNTNNAITCEGQIIPLSGQCQYLELLGLAVNGNKVTVDFTVTYTDNTTTTITQNFSDWYNNEGFPNESVAYYSSYRNRPDGGHDPGPQHLFLYKWQVDDTKVLKSITLPNNPAVDFFAINYVSSITGIVGWYEADTLGLSLNNGDSVPTWNDLSGLGNTLGAVGTQPTWHSDVINGHSVVRFNGSTDYMQSVPVADGSNFSVFVVCKQSSPNTFMVAMSWGNGGGPVTSWLGIEGGDRGNFFSVSDSTTDLWSSNAGDQFFHVLEQVHSGSTMQGWMDGAYLGESTSSGARNSNLITLGAYSNSPQLFWNGDIAAIMLVNGAVSDNTRKILESYFAKKYNLVQYTLLYDADSNRVSNFTYLGAWPACVGNDLSFIGGTPPSLRTNAVNTHYSMVLATSSTAAMQAGFPINVDWQDFTVFIYLITDDPGGDVYIPMAIRSSNDIAPALIISETTVFTRVRTESTDNVYADATNIIGSWHLVCMEKNDTSVSMFIDDMATPVIGPIANSGNDFTVNSVWVFSGAYKNFSGSIARISAFNRALSQDERLAELAVYRSKYNSGCGSALVLDGTDQYAELPSPIYSAWNNLGSGTISLWFFLNAFGTENEFGGFNQAFFVKQHDGVNSYTVLGTTLSGSNNLLHFQMSNGQGSMSGSTPLALSTWYHVVVTWDGTTISLYLNGLLDKAMSSSATLPDDTSITIVQVGAWSASNKYMNGAIDELTLFTRVLSKNEIAMLYNFGLGSCGNTSASPWNSGLVAGYHFTDATDYSGNGCDSTFVNGATTTTNSINCCS